MKRSIRWLIDAPRVSFALAAFLVLAAVGLFPRASMADTVVYDPLHGYCAGTAQCMDNGTNSPTTTNAPANFGFTVSPGPASGDLLIDLLAPNNEAADPSYALTGSLSGTANLVSATAWTSGNLDAYLGISAAPANPIGAYLPSTQALDPGATGFFVYQVDLGAHTLQGPSNPNVFPLENISQGVPLASYLVGFLNEGTANAPSWVATANSGAILEDAPPGTTRITPTPEPGSLALMASGLVGLAGMVRRRFRVGAFGSAKQS
jgi:hypothetical protein